MFNAIWAWSAHALAEIAEAVGEDGTEFREDGERIVHAIEAHLWHAGHRWTTPYDVQRGMRMSHRSIVSIMPIIAPGIDRAIVERIAQVIRAVRHREEGHRYLFPTEGPRSHSFSPRRYWRGPVWANTNWLLERGGLAAGETGLALEIRESTLELIATHGFREYFDPSGAQAYGARDVSWTAAPFLDLALDG